jgi:hypothetical protein
MKKEAKDYFRGKERYNCVQAIMKVFCRWCKDKDIHSFRKIGHGKAPEGLCGAVYAAGCLLEDDARQLQMKKMFTDEAGSVKCREILKKRKVSCERCVDLAAEILKRYGFC